MPRIYDISTTLSPRLAVWPGDVPVHRETQASLDRGDPTELSALRTTLHAGTHVDAPSHVRHRGATVDRLDVELGLGPCQVVQVTLPPGAPIRPQDLPGPLEAPRVLFRTDGHPDPECFPETFNALSPALAAELVARGVRLVGIDAPSVDPVEAQALEAHRILLGSGIPVLEGLVLRDVPPGRYLLCALPLKIEGGEASPLRAVLLEGDGLDAWGRFLNRRP